MGFGEGFVLLYTISCAIVVAEICSESCIATFFEGDPPPVQAPGETLLSSGLRRTLMGQKNNDRKPFFSGKKISDENTDAT